MTRSERRTKTSTAAAARLPSKEAISEFVADSPKRVGRREIARAFGIKGADRMALKSLLKEMASEGRLGDSGRKRQGGSDLPPVGPADVLESDSDGTVWIRPLPGDGTLRLRLRGLNGAEAPSSLGAGDRVLARFVRAEPKHESRTADPEDAAEPGFEARFIRKIPVRSKRLLGIVSGAPGRLQLEPISRSGREEPVPIAQADQGSVAVGDLVTATLSEGRSRSARPAAVHGRADRPESVSLIALAEHDIPHEFPEEVLAEAARAEPPDAAKLLDRTGLPLVTIDPEDARDHDDAVHAEPDRAPANRGGWILTVAIADVALYVRHGTALDREALRRGNSVYFPGRVVPMLPEELSNDLCSLKANVERPAMIARIVIDAAGVPISQRFERAMIRSRARLSYSQAQAAIDGQPDDVTRPLLDTVLRPLWSAYEVLAKARDARAPLDLDLPERRIVLDDNGVPTGIVTPPRLAAHRLVEEFMIQANVAAAKVLNAKQADFLRRVHEAPAPEKVEALARYLTMLDMRLPRGQVLTPAHFNRLIDVATDTPHSGAISDAILRAQSQAHYAPRDQGHFGLNLRAYAHFTSPIRRYADVIVHRALIAALDLGTDGLTPRTAAILDQIGIDISAAERRAMAAERDTTDRLIAHFLKSQVGAAFDGRVTGIVRSGLFVELDETGADGFVPAALLGREFGDYYRADEAAHALIGEASGKGYRAGDAVRVRLTEADPLRGRLNFALLTEPREIPRPGRSSKSRRQGKGRPGKPTKRARK